jgi:hypothetical protein
MYHLPAPASQVLLAIYCQLLKEKSFDLGSVGGCCGGNTWILSKTYGRKEKKIKLNY